MLDHAILERTGDALLSPDVRYWHIADVPLVPTNVCFKGNSGRDAGVTPFLLMTQSGHPRFEPRQAAI
jgi:hypothetical protein